MFDERIALHRCIQQIAWRGQMYTFNRRELNEFNEQSSEPIQVTKLKGLFHNGSSNHLTVSISDGAQTPQKDTPYIMAAWDRAKVLKINDEVTINNRNYKVTSIGNINEYNIVAEISLEVILDVQA